MSSVVMFLVNHTGVSLAWDAPSGPVSWGSIGGIYAVTTPPRMNIRIIASVQTLSHIPHASPSVPRLPASLEPRQRHYSLRPPAPLAANATRSCRAPALHLKHKILRFAGLDLLAGSALLLSYYVARHQTAKIMGFHLGLPTGGEPYKRKSKRGFTRGEDLGTKFRHGGSQLCEGIGQPLKQIVPNYAIKEPAAANTDTLRRVFPSLNAILKHR
ncbi:hypothetical protein B0H19DRAFT_1084354 [Mycena capillaripes]|nr:hypothetical protein B0H19DRAFT_1084354 [Mycena capillaripes]